VFTPANLQIFNKGGAVPWQLGMLTGITKFADDRGSYGLQITHSL